MSLNKTQAEDYHRIGHLTVPVAFHYVANDVTFDDPA
jgi:hypothetical protein